MCMDCVESRHLATFCMLVHKVAMYLPWYEQVVWVTSEDPMKTEEFTEQELRQSGYLTQRFTEQTWFNPAIQHLQRVTSVQLLAPVSNALIQPCCFYIPHHASYHLQALRGL